MKHTIEQKLLASRPERLQDTDSFVAKTMRAVATASSTETFDKVLRTTKDTKKGTLGMKLHNLKHRFNRLPRLAAIGIIIGSTGTVGAAAYATYRWINPKVTITNIQQVNDDNKKQYTIDSQCGDFYSGKALKYEVSRSSGLTDNDANKVFQNTCAYDALGTFIGSKWISDNDHDSFAKKKIGDIVTIYSYDDIFAGSTVSNPVFGLTLGKVTAINQNQVSFSLPLYSVDNSAGPDLSKPRDYYPAGKEFSRTLTLSSTVEVWADGRQLHLSDVHIGDQIKVVTRTQNKVQYYDDIKQNALGEQITFDVVGIIKTNIDTRYVAGGASQIGDPAIVNALAALGPCDNNPEYYCVSVPNQAFGMVYGINMPDTDNKKYQRKDINDEQKVKPYRLHGRITNINGTHVTLETRGQKATFTVDFPYDAVGNYNLPKPVITDFDKSTALKVEVGDLVEVGYGQTVPENHLTIKPSDLEVFAVIEQVQPDGSFIKY